MPQIDHPPTVEILLATYNGERFLRQQIESIIQQTYPHWRLVIRDDASTDGTVALCESFQKRDARITLLRDGLGNLGLVRNFGRLLSLSTAPYLMYCDQDDVWLPEKVEVQLEVLRELEEELGTGAPLALYTDAWVVDANLQPIADSLLAYINRPASDPVDARDLCLQGNCYGCTMMLNRALADLVGDFPPGTISHDWWTGLTAATFGRLGFIETRLVRHRRHTSNVSATKRHSWSRYLRELPSLSAHRRWLKKVYGQWAAFDERYSSRMNAAHRRLFQDLACMQRTGWFRRRRALLRHRLWLTGAGRNLALVLFA